MTVFEMLFPHDEVVLSVSVVADVPVGFPGIVVVALANLAIAAFVPDGKALVADASVEERVAALGVGFVAAAAAFYTAYSVLEVVGESFAAVVYASIASGDAAIVAAPVVAVEEVAPLCVEQEFCIVAVFPGFVVEITALSVAFHWDNNQ